MIGGFEPEAKPWVAPDQLPHPFEFQLLDEDWDHFSILMESALLRIPALHHTGIKQFYNGPESFTPDNQFIIGEAPELRNFFVGAGFNSVGIASAGGAGRALAEWIVEGEPTVDLVAQDIRRFAPFNGNNQWLHDRVGEILGLHYEIPWPNRELVTARPFRRSPVYHLLEEAGALFGSKMGWERANVFAPAGREPALEYTWDKPNWLPWSVEEQRRTRSSVTLFDETSFGKLHIVRPRRRAGAPAAVHGRRGRAGRPVGLHRHAQPPGWLRGRRDGHPAGPRPLSAGDRLGVGAAGPGVDRAPRGPGGARGGGGRVLVLRRLRGDGPRVEEPPPEAHPVGPVRRGVPLRHQPGDRPRPLDGAGHPDHLRGRARVGALRPDRVRGGRLRGPASRPGRTCR